MVSPLDALGAVVLRTRSLVRAPIWLYRHRLGWLLGGRLVMVEHTGRSSGLPRYVCLEVVERPHPDTVVVVSGFGNRAQWYQNLRAHPACRVSWRAQVAVPARARMMNRRESADALQRYQAAHPTAWRRLRGAIERAVGHPVTGLPMVELTMRTAAGSD